MMAMTSSETFSGNRTLKLGYGGWKSVLGSWAGKVRGHLRWFGIADADILKLAGFNDLEFRMSENQRQKCRDSGFRLPALQGRVLTSSLSAHRPGRLEESLS
jgi:hypothetical protein